MTWFYDFLWEAVRNPALIVKYAKEVGISPPPPPEDFYDRLAYVASLAAEALEKERDADVFWTSRCQEAKRFYLEAAQDLESVGRKIKSFELC